MSLFKEINCYFYCKENNSVYKEKEFKCTVVCQSGSISFLIYEMGLQFVIDEKVFRKALADNKTIEAEGIYISFTDENILPVKCKIKIDVTTTVTNFNILNTNNFIGIKNEYLKKILDIK